MANHASSPGPAVPPPSGKPLAKQEEQRRLDLLIPGVISISAIALGAVVILAKSTINRPVALACALGFLSVGVLLGFLFGIPKVFQGVGEATITEPTNGNKPAEDRSVSYRMQVNTNLEQISDWLTKIIVGVGLVELKQIPGSLLRLAAFIQPGLGAGEEARVMALAIILYASLVGFFLGYLVTRTYIAGIFRRADEQLVAQVEVDGVSISIGEAERLQRTIIEDLQEHVARLENAINGPPPGTDDRQPAPEGSDGSATEGVEPDVEGKREGRLEHRAAQHLPRRILWVDDQPENNRYHVAFLHRRGVVVVTARSTAEALELLRREPFDVVLSDTNRIETGRPNPHAGIELAQAIKEQQPHVPLYIYTRPATAPAIAEKARAAGAAAVFSSPTDLLRALHIDCPQ
jgi:CheY-like chemotaxis protein